VHGVRELFGHLTAHSLHAQASRQARRGWVEEAGEGVLTRTIEGARRETRSPLAS
jgi:hypothetical protein